MDRQNDLIIMGGFFGLVIISAFVVGVMFVDVDSSPSDIKMNDIPEEYRYLIVSPEEQNKSSVWYANGESGINLNREWEEYDRENPEEINNGSHLVELTQYPESKVTLAQLNEAWELYYQTYQSAENNGWFNVNESREDDYFAFDSQHHVNIRRLQSEEDLNPQKVESLMYREQEVETIFGENKTVERLTGVMYLEDSFDHGEQIGGPLTVWHYHPITPAMCPGSVETRVMFEGNYTLRRPLSPEDHVENSSELLANAKECDVKRNQTVEMVHVWFEKRRAGPFGSHMASRKRAPPKYEMMDKSEFIEYTLDSYEAILNNNVSQYNPEDIHYGHDHEH